MYPPQRNKIQGILNAAETLKFSLKISYVPPCLTKLLRGWDVERNNCKAIKRFYVSAFYPSMKFYYTYILQSLKNKSLYIGYTSDLKKRLKKHNSGSNKATMPFIPYQLIYYEAFLNRVDAKRREIYLKSGWGRKSMGKILERYFEKGVT